MLAEAQRIGAIGPAPLSEHIRQSRAFFAAIADLSGSGWRLLDLGSGGGLPGLVLACEHPDLTVTLLDGRTMRVRALEKAVAVLGIDQRVQVIEARAEEAAYRPELRGQFDMVVARGFGPPGATAECGAPFLRIGGLLVVSDPPGGQPARWPEEGVRLLGLEMVRSVSSPWAFSVLCAAHACPATFPRRTGIPRKRPLF